MKRPGNLYSQRKRNIQQALGMTPRQYRNKISLAIKSSKVGRGAVSVNGRPVSYGWKAAAMPAGSPKSAVGRFKWKGEPGSERRLTVKERIPGQKFDVQFYGSAVELPGGVIVPAVVVEKAKNSLGYYDSRREFSYGGFDLTLVKSKSYWGENNYSIKGAMPDSFKEHDETVKIGNSLVRKRMSSSHHAKSGHQGTGPVSTGSMAARRIAKVRAAKAKRHASKTSKRGQRVKAEKKKKAQR